MSAESNYRITITVNGQLRQVTVEPRLTLSHLLREHLHLTGTKEGCALGTCGACTVLVDGTARLSCLTLAVQCDGSQIQTIEGGAGDPVVAALQEAFVACDALQCGFCTPGQIMAAAGLLGREKHPAPEQIRRATAGNICRCGAYLQIREAVAAAAESLSAGGRSR
ncbi:MAG: (2Fe-2S)-binding protein [Armatimonadetes bacterium]|nr:(2Fe-2S)-binding protein [Armatimonadota bacterium]